MTTKTITPSTATESQQATPYSLLNDILHGLRLVVIVSVIMLGVIALLTFIIQPLMKSLNVQEDFTGAVATLLTGVLPFAVYMSGGIAARRHRQQNFLGALISALLVAAIGYGVLIGYQYVTESGVFRQAPTLGFSMQQTEAGIEITAIEPGTSAEEAGLLPGDIITALRRDPVTVGDLTTRIAQAELDDAFRFRITRDGEEIQLNTRIQLASQIDTASLTRGILAALIIAFVALIIPAKWVPYLILGISLLPLIVGYLWLITATFSTRTIGLLPVDIDGNFGGWTLDNWSFLTGTSVGGPTTNIWTVTFNSFAIAIAMTIASLVICSMSGYALSRMHFPARRALLSMTLVLHGFPAVTLIIPIFLVLINLGNIPIIGDFIGYNTVGGIALVMIAFELPLGIWLMKGFFDNISWDMERSALIDGASRWRTFWEIIMPQIRPGLLALGIFSFIGGWNAYLIPATYSVGTGLATLPVYIRQLTGELSPVNWNQVAAIGLFQLIPIFCFFIFAQEYLLNIYAGGTKGSS